MVTKLRRNCFLVRFKSKEEEEEEGESDKKQNMHSN